MILVWKPDHLVKSRPQRRNICTGRSCLVRRGGRRSDTPACFSPHQSHSLGTDVCLRGRRLGWRWSSWRWELKWVLGRLAYYIIITSYYWCGPTSSAPSLQTLLRSALWEDWARPERWRHCQWQWQGQHWRPGVLWSHLKMTRWGK